MNDVKYSGVVLNSISGLVIVFCSLLVYILVAINISLVVTSITFIFGLIYLFLARPLLIKTKAAARENVATNKQVAHYVNENVIGMKTIKVFAVEDYINELVKKKFLILRNLKVKVLFLGSIGGSIMQLFSVLFIGVIFIVFYKITDFNLGSFLALVYLIQKIFTYFGQLQNQLQKAIEAVPYLMSVLNFEEKARQFKEEESGKVNFQTGDTISFNQVNFSYNLKKVNILNKINFNIKKGEIVGIIGPSGAGKTTIVDLVLRLFNPTAGKILLGDRDIKNISIKEWRDKIGYVSQDIFLVNDTIENNIRFYNDLLTYADIEEASKKANIYNFIMSTSAGFQTLVGERGNLLSGGQRQRIVIARVLARRPEILILDEATSALDNESESQIQRVIENLKGKMTVLIVAHRLSTISNCDRLLVLNDGEIVEEGKPDVLLQDKDSYFYKVYNR
jgi:ABC-type multidrug transport system fused ATPase/permease subunit